MKTHLRRSRRSRRSGFTLLELLLVMAILVVLASLSTVAILSMQASAYKRAAFTEISRLKTACTAYKLNVGSFPSELNDLFQMPSGLTQAKWQGPYVQEPIAGDPWSRPYNYSVNESTNQVTISSNGADGQSGTEDDVPNQSGTN